MRGEIPPGREALYRSMGGGHYQGDMLAFVEFVKERVIEYMLDGNQPQDIVILMAANLHYPKTFNAIPPFKIRVILAHMSIEAPICLLSIANAQGQSTLRAILAGNSVEAIMALDAEDPSQLRKEKDDGSASIN